MELAESEHLLEFRSFSTHLFPLRVFCEYLVRISKSEIALLLIQPKLTDFGDELTPEVRFASKEAVNTLLRALG